MNALRLSAALLVMAAITARAQTIINIPHIADGGGWQTTLVVTSTTPFGVPTGVACFQETTPGNSAGPWNLFPAQIRFGSSASSAFITSPGTSPTLSTGWCQIAAYAGIQAYAIFTLRVPGRQDQDGTAVGTPAASRFLVPYDQTNGAVVGFAIANTSTLGETISVAARTAQGTTVTSSFFLGGQGHRSFSLQDASSPLGASFTAAIANTSGLIEVVSKSADISVLTLRFNKTQSFTAEPVYPDSGAPVIVPTTGVPPAPFSALYISGTCTCGFDLSSMPFTIMVTPDANPATYTAIFTGYGSAWFFVGTFVKGTLSGQTLTFNSTSGGIYGPQAQKFLGTKLVLTVEDFTLVGSPVNGTSTFLLSSTINGPPDALDSNISGTSTFIR